jgi:hypothetical protein
VCGPSRGGVGQLPREGLREPARPSGGWLLAPPALAAARLPDSAFIAGRLSACRARFLRTSRRPIGLHTLADGLALRGRHATTAFAGRPRRRRTLARSCLTRLARRRSTQIREGCQQRRLFRTQCFETRLGADAREILHIDAAVRPCLSLCHQNLQSRIIVENVIGRKYQSLLPTLLKRPRMTREKLHLSP